MRKAWNALIRFLDSAGRLNTLLVIAAALGGTTLLGWVLAAVDAMLVLVLIALLLSAFLALLWGAGQIVIRFAPAVAHPSRDLRITPETPPTEGWVSPDHLGTYLDSINKKMEEKGFGRNPSLQPETNPQAPTPSWEELNTARNKRYQETRGLFLTHTWEPTERVRGKDSEPRALELVDDPHRQGFEEALGAEQVTNEMVAPVQDPPTTLADGCAKRLHITDLRRRRSELIVELRTARPDMAKPANAIALVVVETPNKLGLGSWGAALAGGKAETTRVSDGQPGALVKLVRDLELR